MLKLIYGSGLRRGELINLKYWHIKSENMSVKLENSKGAKDRETILPNSILPELRGYYKSEKPDEYIFYVRSKKHPITASAIRWAFKQAVNKAGIKKKSTPSYTQAFFCMPFA